MTTNRPPGGIDPVDEGENFVGRAWLRDQILDWSTLDEPCLLLVGEPGIGKSAFLRHFARDAERSSRLLTRHFCLGDDAETLKSWRFVESVANGLQRYEGYRRLLDASPRYRSWLEPHALVKNPLMALDRAVIEPCWQTAAPSPTGVFLVVDAVDESLMLRDDVLPLVQLLASRQDRWPPWVRLVLSTRPFPAVLELFAGRRRLVMDPNDPRNREDLKEFLHRDRGVVPKAGLDALLDASAGNFLVAELIAAASNRPAQGGSVHDRAPASYSDYCGNTLRRHLPQDPRDVELARTLLAVLRAAREPLAVDDLVASCEGWSKRDVTSMVRSIRPFLRSSQQRYSLYHQSFHEYLAGDHCLPELATGAEVGHLLLGIPPLNVAHRRRGKISEYQLRHGVSHLHDAKRYSDAVVLLAYLLRSMPPGDPDSEQGWLMAGRELAVVITPETEGLDKLRAPDLLILTDCFYEVEPLRRVLTVIRERWPTDWGDTVVYLLDPDRCDTVVKLAAGRVEADGRLRPAESLLSDPDVRLNDEEVSAWALSFEVSAAPRDREVEQYLGRRNDLLAIVTDEKQAESWWFRYILNEFALHILWSESELARHPRFVADALDWSGCHWGYTQVVATDVVALLPESRWPDAPYFCTADSLRDARAELELLGRLRDELEADPALAPASGIIRSYRSLRNQPEQFGEAPFLDMMERPGSAGSVRGLFRLLLSHPVWHVAEAAASLLASLARLHWSEISRWIDDWLEAPDLLGWRLHYGAIEAAFCVFRFDDGRPTRFEKALERFAASPNPRIRSLCAENAASIVLMDRQLNVESISHAAYHDEYVRTWIGPVPVLDRNPPVYCPQTLEIMHAYFSKVWKQTVDLRSILPTDAPVCPLLEGDPPWFGLRRGEFLTRISTNLARLL